MKSNLEHSFIYYLTLCLGVAMGICALVELTCLFLGIAPFFTPSPALNAKLRFLKDHPPGNASVGLISGASVALNDIDSDLLEDAEQRPFLNFGANGISVPTSQRIYDQLSGLFAIREVIFAVDPLEMRDTYRLDIEVPPSVFRRYVLGRMTIAEEFTYRDIPGLMSYWRNWHDYRSRANPASLVFSKTGAVPLEMGRENADPRQWSGETIELALTCLHCTDDLARYCTDVRSQRRSFSIVLGPIRAEVLERMDKVRAVVADRRARIQEVARGCGATLFDLTEYARISDSCFANSVHLNAHGMHALTEQLVRYRRGESLARGMGISCEALPLAGSTSAMHAEARSP
jgi:hypothetical protein